MAVQYKKLTEKELSAFIQMRISQLREEGATEDIDLKPAFMDYYKRHMADGTFVSWLAVDKDHIVEQAVCLLSKDRHILDVRMGKSDCFPVCLLPRIIADRELQKSCYLVL